MFHDPFNTPVEAVKVPVVVDLPVGHEPDLFFDGDRFLQHLNRTYHTFDVATYSLSRSLNAPLKRINRLLTNLPLQPGSAIKPKETRVIVNNHAKIYICYDSDDVMQHVFIGSQNLTHGTQINLMCRVHTNLNKCLLKFFNTLWSASTLKETRNDQTTVCPKT